MARPEDVTAFLKQAKSLIQSRRRTIWPNRKDWDTFVDLMRQPREAWDVICGLTWRDYVAGPKADDKPERGWTVWEFCTTVDGKPIYIKLAVVVDKRTSAPELICSSFHRPEFLVHLPYR